MKTVRNKGPSLIGALTEPLLTNVTLYINDTAHGIFLRYHENGQISQRGAFDNGAIIGDRIYLRSVDKTTENFPRVDERVHKVVFSYTGGQISKQTFFSETGAELLPDGDEMPVRPHGIPEGSHFSPSLKLWEHGDLSRETDTAKPLKQGLWRYWNTTGKLVQETSYQRDKKHGAEKLYDPETGSVTEDNKYEMGEECGQRKREFQSGYFAFGGDWTGQGEVRGPRQVGRWDFHSETAKLQFDFGVECKATELIEAKLFDFDDRDTWTFENLINKAEAYAIDRKLTLALFCQIRAASEFENRGHLWAFLRAYSLPLSFGAAYEEAASCGKIWSRMPFNEEDTERSSAVYLLMYLDQIIRGAAPEKMLQQAAIYFDIHRCHRLAQLLIKGTLLLAPERADFAFNAGLIAMSLGDLEQAKACAVKTLKTEPKMGQHLQNYIDLAFVSAELALPNERSFSFSFENSPFGRHEVVLKRELSEIQDKIASSLGWLTVLREVAIEKIEPTLTSYPDDIFWLPKDYSNLVGPSVMEEQRKHRGRIDGLALPDLLSEVRMMSRFVATLC
jgi:antitoxin component YwqK of YwqJK toxin-antitoxin module